jgi:translation initiation factor IF-2
MGVLVPISKQEIAGKMIKAEEMSPKMVIDSVKDAVKSAVSAMEAGNKDKAVTEAKEAEETHEKIESQLMAWSMEKHEKLETELDALIAAAEKGDLNAMKKAQQEINTLLEEFEMRSM